MQCGTYRSEPNMKVPPHSLRLSSCVYLPSVNSQGNHFPYMEAMYLLMQRAKKVLSDSPGLVHFAIGLVNSFFNLPDGQVMFYEEFEWQKNKKFLGLVEMTSGLVNASFSLPEWQAVKMIFFAPCNDDISSRHHGQFQIIVSLLRPLVPFNLVPCIDRCHMTSRRPCWCPKPVLWELNSFLI